LTTDIDTVLQEELEEPAIQPRRFELLRKCFKKLRIIFWNINKKLFNFHTYNISGRKKEIVKPYMILPCSHGFHSSCLELWFKESRQCPTCRSIIDI